MGALMTRGPLRIPPRSGEELKEQTGWDDAGPPSGPEPRRRGSDVEGVPSRESMASDEERGVPAHRHGEAKDPDAGEMETDLR